MTDISRIEKLLQPAAREKADQAVLLFKQQLSSSTGSVDLDRLASEAVQSKFTNLSVPEIDVLSAFVMSEALRATEEELKEVEGELNQLKQGEDELQEDIRAVDRLVELVSTQNQFVEGLSLEDLRNPDFPDPEIPDLVAEVSSTYVLADSGTKVTVGSLKVLLDKLKEALDGMNELSEMCSLRLQMTMDRRSKFISTLSNSMKKISTTQDMLVQNIK
jgi:hypothetical protein